MSSNDELYRLVADHCTADQVRALLRAAKGNAGVRLSAESKSDLVMKNLREAVEARSVPIERVHELLRNSEENGDQHLFYFRPRSKKIVEELTLERVGERLWGPEWAQTQVFPQLVVEQPGYIHADFRLWSPGKKPRDWVLKVYGREVHSRATGKVVEETEDRFLIEYVREVRRVVLLARWNSPDLLEIRVPRDQSKRRVLGWVQQVWQMLAPALEPAQFEAWDLSSARRRIIEEEEQHATVYQFRDVRLMDGDYNRASFECYDAQGHLFRSREAKDSIRSYIRNEKGACTHLSTSWLSQKDGVPSRELRTLIGHNEPNEVVVAGQCRAVELDYVTEQLRHFSKRASGSQRGAA